MERIAIVGDLWRWTGGSNAGAWHFLTIAGEAAETLAGTALMRRLEGLARGFGSLRVTVTIGDTRWQTSVFPQKEGTWLLPVKAAVRKAEALHEGEPVHLLLEF